MKKILGLDLGTTSIGWAFVNEAETVNEKSSILGIGVRVNPLTTDEQLNFDKGKPTSINADRTLKRGARRTLDRYKQRRANLIDALKKAGIINSETKLSEHKKGSTHETYLLRSKAVTEQLSNDEFARVLLMINKKRGYKSSRKAKNEDEGQLIDGMEIARKLNNENLTPGQYCFQLLSNGAKRLPDFYRSDLNKELDNIWKVQKDNFPEILTEDFRKLIAGKGQKATAAIIKDKFGFYTAENKGKGRKIKAYEWRSMAISGTLTKEELAYVIVEVNGNIYNSSGYLGEISDRSKELFFGNKTIGQYLYEKLANDPNYQTKKKVFYRQDYIDEFEKIWESQSRFNPLLTEELKSEIRDIIIFYQRKLKSQKGLISICEFEKREIEIIKEGKPKRILIGPRVAPRSSPVFQEFKIWQRLNDLRFQHAKTKEIFVPELWQKKILFDELWFKGNLPADRILQLLKLSPKEWKLNFKELEGNRTNQELNQAFLDILELAGIDTSDVLGLKPDQDNVSINKVLTDAEVIKQFIKSRFTELGINTDVLEFNSDLEGVEFISQPSYQLWHILYSYEGDDSQSGNETLYRVLNSKFGFRDDFAKILSNVGMQEDYASLSVKALKKMLPFLKEGHPYARREGENELEGASSLAGYNHSASYNKDENESRVLKGKLEILPKNSLRNPVVEKILNQMVNIVNSILQDPNLGRPDEIRIELARELKKNAREREELTKQLNQANKEHEEIREILKKEDNISNPTRNDIIRYKLYQELKDNGYKTLYSNTYIPREKLFSKEFDIEHILPKARIFDDSFSNKTLETRDVNLKKADQTAADFVLNTYGQEQFDLYVQRIEMLLKAPEGGISKGKYMKLLKKSSEIGDGFIERDLRESQYIAKKAKEMLFEISRSVISTSGNITQKLREDWGLVNVMQELNIDKYRKLGLTEFVQTKDGNKKERIVDWTKRNDHRHHAMDAITVAFTKHSHIQYLNHLNARKNEKDKWHASIMGIENKETELVIDDSGNKTRKFKPPMPNLRDEAKKHLESVLISFKAKNKVATKNKNKIKTSQGIKIKTELTPRGQLHKETVYGSRKVPVFKTEIVGAKFDEDRIKLVENKLFRHCLLNRLRIFDGDPKKAFTGSNSLEKKPLFLNDEKTEFVPKAIRLKWFETDYTIRKDITPENFKDIKSIEKVADEKVKKILKERLEEFNGNAKAAFSNLDLKPIWLNEQKGICIKRTTITGVNNVESLHTKRDHFGLPILDKNGKEIPNDFVSTGNNHHVAIYRDANGELQEKIVSLFEAIHRVNQGLSIIDRHYKVGEGYQFLFTLKQNEYFVFPGVDFNPLEIDLLDHFNYSKISPNLFRVQKITSKDYFFRHHLETNVTDNPMTKYFAWRREGLKGIDSVIKVRINHLGKIIQVGEY